MSTRLVLEGDWKLQDWKLTDNSAGSISSPAISSPANSAIPCWRYYYEVEVLVSAEERAFLVAC